MMNNTALVESDLIMSDIVSYNKHSEMKTKARSFGPDFIARRQVLFAIFSLVVISAVFIPVPERFLGILDAGWILTCCLSVTVLILSVTAKNLFELSGFASFVISITMLRLWLAAVSSKSIIIHQSAGSMIEKTGSFLILENLSLYAIVIPVILFASVVMIFITTASVLKKTSKYASETLPFKYISAEADLNASVITHLQAAKIKNRIKSEAKFYVSMSSTAKFLRFDSVINVFIVGFSTVGILKSHAETSSGGIGIAVFGDGSLEVGTMLSVGLLAVTFLPAVVLAFSSGNVINKENLLVDNDNKNYSETTNSGTYPNFENNDFELLNPDFAEVSSEIKNGKKFEFLADLEISKDNNKPKPGDNETVESDIYTDITDLVVNAGSVKKVSHFLF